MNCARCGEAIRKGEEAVRCYGSCEGSYHLDCTNMSVRTYRKKSEEQKRKWECISCKENLKKIATKKRVDCVASSEESNGEEEEEEVIARKDSLSSVERKLDLLLKGQSRTNNAIEKLEETVKFLRNELLQKDKAIEELKDELHEFQQHYRNSYLEIHNLPEVGGEDKKVLEKHVIKIAAISGVELKEDDIEEVHRIPTKNRDKIKPVIVHLSSRKKRNAILSELKKVKLTQDTVINNKNNSRVYVNESLTKYNKELLFECKRKAMEINYKYVWTAEGKILMRAEERGRVIRIKTLSDLQNLTKRQEEIPRSISYSCK